MSEPWRVPETPGAEMRAPKNQSGLPISLPVRNLKNPGMPPTPTPSEEPGTIIPGYVRTQQAAFHCAIPRGFRIVSPGGSIFIPPITPQNQYPLVHMASQPTPMLAFGTQSPANTGTSPSGLILPVVQPFRTTTTTTMTGTQTTPSLRTGPAPVGPMFVPYCDLSTPVTLKRPRT